MCSLHKLLLGLKSNRFGWNFCLGLSGLSGLSGPIKDHGGHVANGAGYARDTFENDFAGVRDPPFGCDLRVSFAARLGKSLRARFRAEASSVTGFSAKAVCYRPSQAACNQCGKRRERADSHTPLPGEICRFLHELRVLKRRKQRVSIGSESLGTQEVEP